MPTASTGSEKGTERRLHVVVVVHGRGRGHAMRALAIVPALRARGHRVVVWAGGAAVDALAQLPVDRIIDTVAPGPALASRFAARTGDDLLALFGDRPDVLVSDGDGPSIHAATLLGIRTAAVGHGLLFAYARLPGRLSPKDLVREALNALSSSWLSRAQVAVHFGRAEPRFASTRVACIEVREGLDRAAPLGDHLVAYFRDGGGDAWLAELAARGERVMLFTPAKTVPRGVERHEPDHVAFARALSTAKGAVGTAGSNLVAECVHLGIPLLALPDDSDVEQRLNAQILTAMGRGRTGSLGRPSAATIDAFRADASRVRSEGRLSDGLAGLEGVARNVVDAVESLAVD